MSGPGLLGGQPVSLTAGGESVPVSLTAGGESGRKECASILDSKEERVCVATDGGYIRG